MSHYVVRRRPAPPFRPSLRDRMLRRPPRGLVRPWELVRDGTPIGFYETREAAIEASPEPPAELIGDAVMDDRAVWG